LPASRSPIGDRPPIHTGTRALYADYLECAADGGPMPLLAQGSTGEVVRHLQNILTVAAPGQWDTTPQGIDDDFGPHTRASV
jgi:hypothetical protein